MRDIDSLPMEPIPNSTVHGVVSAGTFGCIIGWDGEALYVWAHSPDHPRKAFPVGRWEMLKIGLYCIRLAIWGKPR